MILGGPKDTITSLRTKGLKALVPPNSFGPPPMGAVGLDFKDRAPVPSKKAKMKNLPCKQAPEKETNNLVLNEDVSERGLGML